MRCENCKERDAVIHLTQIVSNSVTTIHLCEPCAAEKGVETGANVAKFPLGDFVASLGKPGAAEQAETEAEAGRSCAFCGATLHDFRQTGRLGCGHCYSSFGPQMRDLLRRLQGSTQHIGESYRAPGAARAGRGASRSELVVLREQLRRAIEVENFELAAELRDKIRVLE